MVVKFLIIFTVIALDIAAVVILKEGYKEPKDTAPFLAGISTIIKDIGLFIAFELGLRIASKIQPDEKRRINE